MRGDTLVLQMSMNRVDETGDFSWVDVYIDWNI